MCPSRSHLSQPLTPRFPLFARLWRPQGITLLSWGSDTGAAFEACKAERGYVASDEDELSEAKVGAEQLTGILGAVTKL